MNLKVIIIFILLFITNCVLAQSDKDYKFINDYLKQKHFRNDSTYFITKFDLNSHDFNRKEKSINRLLSQYKETFNAVLDSNIFKKLDTLSFEQVNIRWDKNEIKHKFFKSEIKEGFRFIQISKPIYINTNFVIILEYSGKYCVGFGTSIKLIKWDEQKGKISIIEDYTFSRADPCWR